MHHHFSRNLKVKGLIESSSPSLVVELGTGGGENTEQLALLSDKVGFDLIAIDVILPVSEYKHPKLRWLQGVSYVELGKMGDASVDFCVLDTDHNYWTLKKELEELRRVMTTGGIVAIHDTESYKNDNGYMPSGYGQTGVDYPMEVMKRETRPYADAINDTIGDWEVVAKTKASCGAIALQK